MNFQPSSLFNHNVKWELLNEKPSSDFKTLQLYVFSNKKKEFQFKTLIKTGSRILKQCKNNKIKFLDVKNCVLKKIHHYQNGDGIMITSGNFQFEFYGQITEWFDQLKLYCIQVDFLNNYSIGNLIGKGTYGKVYKAIQKQNKSEYAVKTFDKSNLQKQIEIEAILREIDILRIVQHPRVIKLLETYESETHIFVVYELLKGGELKQLMNEKKLNQEQCVSIIYKIIDALAYIHSKGIIHRDLKPENLIFRYAQNIEDIVIADFGLADFYRKDGKYLFARCGTAGYLAPELIMNKIYDYKVDVYSVGIVFYMLINGGKSPFEKIDYATQLQQNMLSNIDLKKLIITNECSDLLSKMIDANPLSRITSQQAKIHPLFHKQHEKIEMSTARLPKSLTISLIDTPKIQAIQSTRQKKQSFVQMSQSAKNSPIDTKKIQGQQNFSNAKQKQQQ
ncbi:unnamed protein product [Paramecium octaurelia]|uniref:non-specific serine/threonine protein kinase n=1 Tax=Paramecium octaurelia TaxID=43137 RepID=A0A8S1URQ1_PAROT|nr:unnamed protein product [Paramecium octaurelia]